MGSYEVRVDPGERPYPMQRRYHYPLAVQANEPAENPDCIDFQECELRNIQIVKLN